MSDVDWKDRITLDPGVLAGKPVVMGTRVSVSLILEMLMRDWPHERILSNYPQLSPDDILAALAYARDCVKLEKVYLIPE